MDVYACKCVKEGKQVCVYCKWISVVCVLCVLLESWLVDVYSVVVSG